MFFWSDVSLNNKYLISNERWLSNMRFKLKTEYYVNFKFYEIWVIWVNLEIKTRFLYLYKIEKIWQKFSQKFKYFDHCFGSVMKMK